MLVPAVGVQRGLLFRIPDALSDVEAALAEPLACVVNGQRKNGIALGDVVLVIGAGPIGLMHLQLARLQGARKVLVSEPSAHRRALAGELGATRTIDPTAEDLLAVVQEETDGDGADVTVAAIGVAGLTNTLLNVTRPGGRVNLFAGYSGTGETTHRGEPDPLRRADRHRHQRLHAGGLPHRPRPPGRRASSRPAPWSPTASPSSRSSAAFETTRSGEGLRVVVEP